MLCDAFSVVPYAAFKWAKAKLDPDPFHVLLVSGTTISPPQLENAKQWGYALGVTIASCKVWSLTVEGRFADESAIHVKLHCKTSSDLREDIYRKIKQTDWILLEFHHQVQSLENIFRALTKEN